MSLTGKASGDGRGDPAEWYHPAFEMGFRLPMSWSMALSSVPVTVSASKLSSPTQANTLDPLSLGPNLFQMSEEERLLRLAHLNEKCRLLQSLDHLQLPPPPPPPRQQQRQQQQQKPQACQLPHPHPYPSPPSPSPHHTLSTRQHQHQQHQQRNHSTQWQMHHRHYEPASQIAYSSVGPSSSSSSTTSSSSIPKPPQLASSSNFHFQSQDLADLTSQSPNCASSNIQSGSGITFNPCSSSNHLGHSVSVSTPLSSSSPHSSLLLHHPFSSTHSDFSIPDSIPVTPEISFLANYPNPSVPGSAPASCDGPDLSLPETPEFLKTMLSHSLNRAASFGASSHRLTEPAPPVGKRVPISDLVLEFANASAIYKEKTAEIATRFGHMRRCAGDGRCGWRAVIFSFFELACLLLPQDALAQLKESISALSVKLNNSNYPAELLDDMSSAVQTLVIDFNDGSTISSRVSELESRFNDSFVDNNVVSYFKFLVSAHMQANEEVYSPFIGTDETVSTFCRRSIEPVVYLDQSKPTGSQKFNVVSWNPSKEGVMAADDSVVTLLYRPGHYDILYSKSSRVKCLDRSDGDTVLESMQLSSERFSDQSTVDKFASAPPRRESGNQGSSHITQTCAQDGQVSGDVLDLLRQIPHGLNEILSIEKYADPIQVFTVQYSSNDEGAFGSDGQVIQDSQAQQFQRTSIPDNTRGESDQYQPHSCQYPEASLVQNVMGGSGRYSDYQLQYHPMDELTRRQLQDSASPVAGRLQDQGTYPSNSTGPSVTQTLNSIPPFPELDIPNSQASQPDWPTLIGAGTFHLSAQECSQLASSGAGAMPALSLTSSVDTLAGHILGSDHIENGANLHGEASSMQVNIMQGMADGFNTSDNRAMSHYPIPGLSGFHDRQESLDISLAQLQQFGEFDYDLSVVPYDGHKLDTAHVSSDTRCETSVLNDFLPSGLSINPGRGLKSDSDFNNMHISVNRVVIPGGIKSGTGFIPVPMHPIDLTPSIGGFTPLPSGGNPSRTIGPGSSAVGKKSLMSFSLVDDDYDEDAPVDSSDNPFPFRPSVWSFERQARWMHHPDLKYTTPSRNVSYNPAHFSNPSFQPEQWDPESCYRK